MNAPCAVNPNVAASPAMHLLQTVRAIQSVVGDGLNDAELTSLLQKQALPTEGGFAFLNYSDRVVTLSVPKQDLAEWYPEAGWITEKKECIAKSIAQKYGLLVCEPPDTLFPWRDAPNSHHHLELSNGRETIITAHSQYLKIRLFISADPVRSTRAVQRPINLGPDLLQELSALYHDQGVN